MKKLGIIGGMGPMATVYFMQLVTEMTDAAVDQDHIEMFVHSIPSIPDRTKFILGESDDNPLPHLLAAGQGLIDQGAEVIAIPCITAHFFEKDLASLLVPCIDSLMETGIYLKDEDIRRVGIMATDGTVGSGLFQKALAGYGIECVLPDTESQKKVMHLIYDNVKAGRPIEMDKFFDVKDELTDKGAEVVILGCTELSVIKRDHDVGPHVLDVLDVLARKSVEMCAKVKKEYEYLL
ncbi:MAG: amino acid racemase [Lachnospiraceae bacterium]|nr:amino acid racemase [Lachnospiraceae bacterium]